MRGCIDRGLSQEGIMPGGLKVRRRARQLQGLVDQLDVVVRDLLQFLLRALQLVGRDVATDTGPRGAVVGDDQGFVNILRNYDGSLVARAGTDGSAILTAPSVFTNGIAVQTADGGVHSFSTQF